MAVFECLLNFSISRGGASPFESSGLDQIRSYAWLESNHVTFNPLPCLPAGNGKQVGATRGAGKFV